MPPISSRFSRAIAAAFLLITGVFFSMPAHAAIADWQKGAIVSPTSPDEYASGEFKTALEDLAATNANSVTLLVPYYQSSVNSTDVGPGWNTPTDAALAAGIKTAHDLDLQVMLRVTLDPKEGWRSVINPADRDAWFAAYGEILLPLAALAESNGAEMLCIGSELGFMTSEFKNYSNTQHWKQLIAKTRKVYSGKLTYSAHYQWPDERNELQFWNDLDYIGVAGYQPLSVNVDKPSVQSLRNSWESVYVSDLKKIQQKFGKPIMLTEAGYRSIADSNRKPWTWELTAKDQPDEASQARSYEGLFTFWNEVPEFAGVQFWQWNIRPETTGSGAVSYSPRGKAAQAVMERWFSASALFAHVYPSKRRPMAGETVLITTDLRNDSSQPLANAAMRLSIYNGTIKIAERVFSDVQVPPKSNGQYTVQWTPERAGNYVMKLGVYNREMSVAKFWSDRALTITVQPATRAQRVRFEPLTRRMSKL